MDVTGAAVLSGWASRLAPSLAECKVTRGSRQSQRA